MGIIIRPCEVSDVPCVRQFVAKTPPLDLHSAFTYWVLFRYETALCHLAWDEENSAAVGFISGVTDAATRDLCYLWQIGIDPRYRQQSVASALIDHFVSRARAAGAARIQFSIEPANAASNALYKRAMRRLGFRVQVVGEVDFFDRIDSKHTHEILFEWTA